jgi:hypothetical protein
LSGDLFGGVTEVEAVQHMLADLHHDLPGIVSRFRQLMDLDGHLGQTGTMLFGGTASHIAWTDARSSYVHGNFIATVLLCQSLAENLLAASLGAGLEGEELPERVSFKQTLARCRARNIIGEQDRAELERLMGLRNPLSHFRDTNDEANIDRRAMTSGLRPEELLASDASFAIGLVARLIAMPPFRLS